jgi:hypothetical protein
MNCKKIMMSCNKYSMNYKKVPINCNRVSTSCRKVHFEMMYNNEHNNPTTSKAIGCWVRKWTIHNINID